MIELGQMVQLVGSGSNKGRIDLRSSFLVASVFDLSSNHRMFLDERLQYPLSLRTRIPETLPPSLKSTMAVAPLMVSDSI